MTSQSPLVSIVTLSFNQAQFLEEAIRSVLEQTYHDVEYIVVDPGSTDGSREIIERYRSRIATVVLEPDSGPADGLNTGFRHATGEILGYLNADDVLDPRAVQEAVDYLNRHPSTDVVSGHARIIDDAGATIRLSHSDPFSLRAFAYGACVLMQASTFFRRRAMQSTKGFNVANRSNWDGELFVDMALQGASFARVNAVWSSYRLHEASITGSRRLAEMHADYHRRMAASILGRSPTRADRVLALAYRLRKYLLTPAALYQRLRYGPVFGSVASRRGA
jgi:glycosyltransferase involved in cell wall biosynthesis